MTKKKSKKPTSQLEHVKSVISCAVKRQKRGLHPFVKQETLYDPVEILFSEGISVADTPFMKVIYKNVPNIASATVHGDVGQSVRSLKGELPRFQRETALADLAKAWGIKISIRRKP